MTSATNERSPLLDASGVSVTFGGLKALSEVDCHVRPSEIVGIIGPNGAGKTTLLNALSRFARVGPDAAVRFDGVNLLKRKTRDLASLGLARTFQNLETSPSSSLWANVLVGAHTRFRLLGGRAPRASIDESAWKYLTVLGIDRWADDTMEEVPYAVRKRAEICRALMTEPKLVLLDEPASGMSGLEKSQLAEALREVHAQTGTAFLIIEHDVGFLTGLCDRLIALNFGRVICEGVPPMVIENEAVIEAYLGRD
jgi:ABC-type branched-subunit amino acid transport system ATPase component